MIPKYYQMHKPVLDYLSDGNVHTLNELKKYIVELFDLSDSEVSEMLSSRHQAVYVNRLGWATTYLKKAGLIERPARSQFVITEAGKKLQMEHNEVIDNTILKRYQSFNDFINPASDDEDDNESSDEETPEIIIDNEFKKMNNQLADDLMSEVMKLSPTMFERMVLDLMKAMGYGSFENSSFTTAVTGDGGIDGIILEDKLGFSLIYMQAKQWAPENTVGIQELTAFVGAIAGKGGKGLFVTTSSFSKTAVDYAKNQHIVLMDRQKLAQNMIEHNFGVRTNRSYEIKTIDSSLFDSYKDDLV